MAISFDEERNPPKPLEMLVTIELKPSPTADVDEEPPTPPLPGKWVYLWGNVWSVLVSRPSAALAIVTDSRIESATIAT